MKNLLLIMLSLSISLSGYGQSIDRTVIGSAGNYSEAADGTSIDFTVGETAVALLGEGPSVAEGFHRSTLSIVVSTDAPTTDWAVRVFPNPTTEWLRIELPETGDFDAQLNAANGDLLWQVPLQPYNNQVSLSTLPAGVYWLSIRNEEGEQQSFQIVKAQL